MAHVAIIAGSGGLTLGRITLAPAPTGDTPYGAVSAAPLTGQLGRVRVTVLARHGDPHQIAPHLINYRANVRLLADLGADRVVALNTVGGISPAAVPGALVVPDQIVDYTWGREHSFASEGDLRHVDFSEPYDAALRGGLLAAARALDVAVIDGGVYGCTQGPRFESSAEIDRMERDGCTLVGMTGMPEAGLARELGLPYASVCLVVNPAAGRGAAISIDAITAVRDRGMAVLSALLVGFLERLERGD